MNDETSNKDIAIDSTANDDKERDSNSANDPRLLEDIVSIEYESLLLGKKLTRIAGFRDPQIGILDRSAYILLVSLEHQAMSISELSEVTGLDASTLNRQTAAMRRDGIIERIADPDGGLARKFTISDKGAERLEKQRHRNLGALSTVLADWSTSEISNFAAALTKFNQSVFDRVSVKGGKLQARKHTEQE
ncbi:MarR family winged helix-turn-helix transcriptional regulator [Bifidobacterium sp.]|jgi:DNA-binding MarR family transcriptional regulator|uniref:MarR family winged helix-turn-helix transcriptional regulator n=1 Tax=Bifidobacterium sp. TaxID=41200 RepID=UPI0025BBF7CD|nr:MarR family transcriptional regulator [Bifidobacterium sp.]MCH4159933.1 winged helix-turn-helix transcriptional regulator [Bifidobacterium sp.]MCH4175130.1 winged helix-turn-helix transcriptional regulator [Bifidobacterium sp.]MCI1635481.1 winged helix-turn-helix transcriptional regulator [Bifidobacterium sp.]